MVALVLAVSSLAVGCGMGGGIRKLSPEEMNELATGSKKFLFLDVREPAELAQVGTLPGYVNIPLDQVERRTAEIPRDTLVVVACNSAQRAAKAAAILEKAGYKQLMLCAIKEYKKKSYKVIYPKPPIAPANN
jgi:rhodanese-related sulfurtransferase